MTIQRLPFHFEADPLKVILLYLEPVEGSKRLNRFAEFSSQLSPEKAEELHQHTLALFGHRHRKFDEMLIENASRGMTTMGTNLSLTQKQKLVFGSYLTKEYSVEAAA